jgi:hypothetical protein
MKATPEQFNQLAGERDMPLNYPAFLDSACCQMERKAKKTVKQARKRRKSRRGFILWLEWLCLLLLMLIAAWLQ